VQREKSSEEKIAVGRSIRRKMGVQRENQEKKVLQLEELLEERWECKGRIKRRKYYSLKNYWKKDGSAKGESREESITA
jgi:hypothetical protein